ncbi:HD domain-containing protein [Neobacillus sp. OS1-32]|jgi:putative hydrolase of HD superfamily|uniref:5'-deoxynucleotidase n=1 Tax=Neobacillus paridis TaxID=2803862 RepID=A0ABS1TP62_9BACI|nr:MULTISPECIES: HD domain-containing protein [Neobacillus]MBL4953125.1 HD domain-containing protein [Neobacillus paridis]WML28594.1 HD domain-containing protein [Neobacillus sp. OS1-32]
MKEENIVSFIKELERLKNNTRTAWTSTGRHESIAEHSWRLCLFTFVLEDSFPDVDFNKVLRMALIHDLGEAYEGDISAKETGNTSEKLKREEFALNKMIEPLSPKIQEQFLALWQEYNQAETKEAKLVKALDKIETIIQHNQGKNPKGFDYQFNLEYGKKYANFDPIIRAIRTVVDQETLQKTTGEKSKDPSAD